jgi:hypothetical protein
MHTFASAVLPNTLPCATSPYTMGSFFSKPHAPSSRHRFTITDAVPPNTPPRATSPYTMGLSSSTPHETIMISENRYDIFHPFSRLPPELRCKIWTLYLVDTAPQIYRFELHYDYRVLYGRSRRLRKGVQLFLQPCGCNPGCRDKEIFFEQPRKASTAARRIASATCVESRQVVLERYPDTLRFRQNLGWWLWRDPPSPDWNDEKGMPEYVLHLNYAKDIIILHATWEDQEAAIKIANFKGSPPADFLKIRHLGISLGSLTVVYYRQHRHGQRGEFKKHGGHCRCETEECLDCCKEEPLPKFLSLFPSLSKFYIAGVPERLSHPPEKLYIAGVSDRVFDDKLQDGNGPTGEANCPCPSSGPRHTWPMIKTWDACGWFVVYDERAACPFPKSDRIEKIRRGWRPHFPYYRALDHLQIRFIQLWDPETLSNASQCSLCHYGGLQY